MINDKLVVNLVDKIKDIEIGPDNCQIVLKEDIEKMKDSLSSNLTINLGIIPDKAKYIVAFKGDSEIRINLKVCSLRTKNISSPEQIPFKLKLILSDLNDNPEVGNYRQAKALKELKDHDWEVFFK